ncbi:MAG: glgB [Acidimicrobiaceae bacterium]|nr:glgB [Acidimicrobiaceae bacterium]
MSPRNESPKASGKSGHKHGGHGEKSTTEPVASPGVVSGGDDGTNADVSAPATKGRSAKAARSASRGGRSSAAQPGTAQASAATATGSSVTVGRTDPDGGAGARGRPKATKANGAAKKATGARASARREEAGAQAVQVAPDLIDETARYLFNEGRNFRAHEMLGAHPTEDGWRFAVWAPNAKAVSVIHDRNGWSAGEDALAPQGSSGIWAGVVKGLEAGDAYKYAVDGAAGMREKADPYAFATEVPPKTASVLTGLEYQWHDGEWMARRARAQAPDAPVSIYEVHLGSWRRPASYEALSRELVEYVTRMGFTHVEFMPVMEHPFYGSWGYQTSGFFAPTSRFGPPEGFMALVDALHQAGVGVILDWVPSHFATDAFSLGEFDGTHLYEHADPSRAIHPDWGSYEFNFGRHEVRSFLVSSATFWLERYHADGLRVDAVASMLYLDYSRESGQWVPNEYGGNEDLEALSFLRQMNEHVHEDFPGTLTVAEESTAWPGVTRPASHGGLGFSLKWDMGWMHDTLTHLSRDPIHRRWHYDELTFRALYANSEAYVLPLSHDEVVYGKGALATKMPGDDWQRRANLRLLFGYQWLLPGKKLIFMGGELATWQEWSHESELEWHLLHHPAHAGVARFVEDLNRTYRHFPALHARDLSPDGFMWVDAGARDDGILAWLRFAEGQPAVLAAINLTPVPRTRRLGVPQSGIWAEVLNSDSEIYGGSGVGNGGGVQAEEPSWNGQPYSVEVVLPPLAVVAFTPR